MHIGLLTTSYPRYDGDYAGAFVREEARALVARGHVVTVVAARSDQSDRVRPRDPAISVFEAPTPANLFYGPGAPERLDAAPLRTASAVPRAFGALTLAAHRHLGAADALIAHWAPCGMVAALVAGDRPFGVVAHSAGARLALAAGPVSRQLLGSALRRAHYVTASDPGLAAQLALLTRRSVHWVGPRVDVGGFEQVLPPSPRRPLRVGFLGRRVPVKGLEVLLEAAAPLGRDGLLELFVAGPGPELAPTAWLEDVGVLEGRDTIRAFMAAIDVLAIPSLVLRGRTEGMPAVLQEAWAAGRPVLASRVGALGSVIPEEWLVAPGDVQAWRQRLEALTRTKVVVAQEARATRERLDALRQRWQRAWGACIDTLRPHREEAMRRPQKV